MAKLRDVSTADGSEKYMFMCPGCKVHHLYVVKWGPVGLENRRLRGQTDEAPVWNFSGGLDAPTFRPSLLYQQSSTVKHRCHLYVTNGQIEFLGDCTHHMVGKTVEMENV